MLYRFLILVLGTPLDQRNNCFLAVKMWTLSCYKLQVNSLTQSSYNIIIQKCFTYNEQYLPLLFSKSIHQVIVTFDTLLLVYKTEQIYSRNTIRVEIHTNKREFFVKTNDKRKEVISLFCEFYCLSTVRKFRTGKKTVSPLSLVELFVVCFGL